MNVKIGASIKEIEINVYGRVQGILFRKKVNGFCLAKGIKGFVQNKEDGSVLIVGQADRDRLNELVKWIQSEPGLSKIERMNYFWKEIVKEYPDFRIVKEKSYFIDKANALVNLGKFVMGKSIESVPRHIAIIPDGNRRWAKEKGLIGSFGHYKAGSFESLNSIINEAYNLGVRYFSIWAFSTENWKRDEKEVKAIFEMISKGVDKFGDKFVNEGVRFRWVGRRDRIEKKLARKLIELEDRTKNNEKFNVSFFLDYGGRDEIVRAIDRIIKKKVKKIDEKVFFEMLDTNGLPEPDLIIRTGGEKRLSGLMPFQGTYAELYFTELYFPDFDARELKKAVTEYSRRQRRFGK